MTDWNKIDNKLTIVAKNLERTRKLGVFLRYLLAFDVLFFVFMLGEYVQGANNYKILIGHLGQIFFVSSMLFGNQAQLGENPKRNRRICVVLLLCGFVIFWYKRQLLG
jgi:uncharacterized membrane protein YjjP (DUF1212 family)